MIVTSASGIYCFCNVCWNRSGSRSDGWDNEAHGGSHVWLARSADAHLRPVHSGDIIAACVENLDHSLSVCAPAIRKNTQTHWVPAYKLGDSDILDGCNRCACVTIVYCVDAASIGKAETSCLWELCTVRLEIVVIEEPSSADFLRF